MPKQLSADDLLWRSEETAKEVLITSRAQALADSDGDARAELDAIIKGYEADKPIRSNEMLIYWVGLDGKLRIYAADEQYSTMRRYVRYGKDR